MVALTAGRSKGKEKCRIFHPALSVSQNYVLRHGNRFVRSRLMSKSSAFRHSRIYRRKIRGTCPRIFRIFIEIGLRPKSLIDFCNSLKGRVRSRTCPCFFGVLVQICHIGCDLDNALGIGRFRKFADIQIFICHAKNNGRFLWSVRNQKRLG